MVKDDIFLDTPTFFVRVSIDSGIVAFDVAVENAKAITGKNFLINFRGFSPVNIFSKIWYTPKHWIASAINTPIIYFASGTNAENPKFAMRTWLIRLGMVGAEFSTARSFLTKNLDGDAAFRYGRA